MTSEISSILNSAEKLREVAKVSFDNVDTDGSGYIDISELATVMKKIASDIGSPPQSEDDIKEVFRELDTKNDDKISLDEFCVLIKQILEVMQSQSC